MSTSAGTPEAGNGRPPPEPAARRGLRDHPLGRILLLAVVLLAALAFARTCGSREDQLSKEEAISIAEKNASYVPCDETGCVVVRAVNQGIPVRLFWIVGLAEDIGASGKPTRVENFLIDAETGEVTRR